MTKSDWLAIASMAVAIIIMLVAPFWSIWVNARISQPKAKPDAANVKNLKARIGLLTKRLLSSAWFSPLFLASLSIFSLIILIRSPRPLTKFMVIEISFCVSSIAYAAASFFLISLLEILRKESDVFMEIIHSIKELAAFQDRQFELHKDHFSITKSITEILGSVNLGNPEKKKRKNSN